MNFTKAGDAYTLADGTKIPCIGFGTWQSADGDEAYSAVLAALRCGYRHIDTAAAYGNEASVGEAVSDFCAESGVDRGDIFVTTKLWNGDHGYIATKAAIDASLSKLGMEYIDMYLIHWPNPLKFRDCWEEKNAESWGAMEDAQRRGKIRVLGVSNFMPQHLEALAKTQVVAPLVNQIKLCPGETQGLTASYCTDRGILLEAYSPMGTGRIFANEDMLALAQKYGVSVAQLCIRWSLQQGYLPLPKSVHGDRIAANLDVFGFSISAEDCAAIAELRDSGINPARNPDTIEF